MGARFFAQQSSRDSYGVNSAAIPVAGRRSTLGGTAIAGSSAPPGQRKPPFESSDDWLTKLHRVCLVLSG